eukprot:4359139-Prymnesium_polylepis.1
MTGSCKIYYVDGKPFPLLTIETTRYCYVRAMENILYNPSGRSTGAFANVMRQANVSPWVVESTSKGISQEDKHTVLQGMGSLLDGEAKGRVRRCSLLSIHDSLMSLSFAPEGDKNTTIAYFLEARDKKAFLQKPEPSDTVRRREKTKRFEFEPSEKRKLKPRR